MLPGPDRVIACPHCGALAKHMTLLSGNTCGARLWTDGKQDAPMLPHPPDVVECDCCGKSYWLADAKRVGEIDVWRDQLDSADPEWASAPEVKEPTEAGYFLAISGDLTCTANQMMTLRILTMWKVNGSYRDTPQGHPAPLSADAVANLESLALLLDDSVEDDRVMKAEILRELGRFDEAKEILSTISSTDYEWVVERIRDLCEQQDRLVREF